MEGHFTVVSIERLPESRSHLEDHYIARLKHYLHFVQRLESREEIHISRERQASRENIHASQEIYASLKGIMHCKRRNSCIAENVMHRQKIFMHHAKFMHHGKFIYCGDSCIA